VQPVARQRALAADLEHSVADVLKRVEEMRAKI